MVKVGILTISDSCYEGKREDKSGNYIKEKMEKLGWKVANYEIVPDEKEKIKSKLIEFVEENIDLILTTGGTGFAERDVTPEATKEILDKEIPGIPEAIRMKTFDKSQNSILSRGISGIKGKTLIINLPGSLKAVEESLQIILPVLPHAIDILKGKTRHEK